MEKGLQPSGGAQALMCRGTNERCPRASEGERTRYVSEVEQRLSPTAT